MDRGPDLSEFFRSDNEQDVSISDTSSDDDTDGSNGKDGSSSGDTDAGSDVDSGNDTDGIKCYSGRPELRAFAEWAFGKDGIPSLKVIACGDYTYGGRRSRYRPVDVILCRPKAESGEAFCILHKFNDEVKEERADITDAYRDVLEACPSERILDWWI